MIDELLTILDTLSTKTLESIYQDLTVASESVIPLSRTKQGLIETNPVHPNPRLNK